ncbi:hypothetical protein KVR01_001650 [Diaporthe batatas]|uniref:uncharacterized protein n=1 Tax=Diaporthe batatas TaxID=748121 RepID=UPI001D0519BB|nr:uncharacterized protein KVR01_001650 [Diaporthe batatas]KAG8168901.1 hypothetical protein KVR01_001650 [Diaporthe batatas]
MNPINRCLGLLASIVCLLASIATAAPLSTLTTCRTTTITPPTSVGCTTTVALTLTTTTITMPSSTTTSYTTITAPVPTGSTVPEYGQCGGLGYAGPTACEDPCSCVCGSDWWCQCQSSSFDKFELQGKVDNIAKVETTSSELDSNYTTATYWLPDLRTTVVGV